MSDRFERDVRDYPRAILHFDGDSFFASVEQAMNYRLRGKPVVTGAERGAATALSIEAKRLGLRRGMPLSTIRALCPEVIVVNSDYTAYSLYARRMYRIVRRYAPKVEEYSIDECFADITRLNEWYGSSYEAIGQRIQETLQRSLGITFGVGLAPNKVVAKMASKHRKPGGFTAIPIGEIETYLKDMPIGSIWGIGSSMDAQLQKLGITTAFDFANKDEAWLKEHAIAKPYREIWYELHGHAVKALVLSPADAGSIMKTRTFSPPSREHAFVYSQLSKNIERACAKARSAGLRPRAVSFFLKTQDFLYRKCELDLSSSTTDAAHILKLIEPHFDRLFVPGILYRATGATLQSLLAESAAPLDLFGEKSALDVRAPILTTVDQLNSRYGQGTIVLGSSLKAINHVEPDRQKKAGKRHSAVTFSLEQKKKTIDLPFLGTAT